MKPRNATVLALGLVAGLLGWLVYAVGDPTAVEDESPLVDSHEEEPEPATDEPELDREAPPELEPEVAEAERSALAIPSDEAPALTAIAPASPDAARVRGTLRDAGTGEPLPEYALRIQDATGRWEDVTTDEHGSFASGSPMAGGVLRITPFDDPSHRRSQPVITAERIVMDGEARELELSVACGPTYRLSISPADAAVPTTLSALLFLRSPDDTRRLGPEPLRAGDPPWVRFAPAPRDFDRCERIEIRDRDGLWTGTTVVSALSGVVPGLVGVLLEARAVLVGKAVDPEGRPVAGASVVFEGATAAGKPYERKARTSPEGEFRLQRLLAGTGSVSVRALRHAGADTTVRLAAGAVTRQEFVLALLPPAGTIAGRVESETGTYFSDVRVVLRPLSGRAPEESRNVRWEEKGGRRVGAFDFPSLPAGEYEISVRDGSWFSWEPQTLRLSPPSGAARFLVRDDLAHAGFAFRARDAETGADLDAVFAWWSVRGGASGSRRVPAGEAILARFPIDRRFQWRIDRQGYRPRFGDERSFALEELRDGKLWRIAELELEPGWGEVFRVVRRGNRKPVSGAQILLDGRPAGKTKGDGTCLVTAREKPRSVEVEYRQWKVAAPVDLRPPWRRKEKRFVEIEVTSPRR